MNVRTLSIVLLSVFVLAACKRTERSATPGDAAAKAVKPAKPASLLQAPSALLAGTALAIAYSGYRTGQHPDRGQGEKAPTDANILEDLSIVKRAFRLIRLYDSGKLSARVLELIAKHNLPLKVMLGAWLKAELSAHKTCKWLTKPIPEAVLAANKKVNAKEIDRAIALANKHKDIVVAVNVGNEALVTWNDHLVSIEALLGYARKVKAAIPQPVTTADNYVVFREQGKKLAKVLDFFAVHTYPVWEKKDIDEAMAFTIANMQSVRDAVPGARLAIGEAGWPSVASEFGPRASPAKQKRYYEELTAWAAKHNITTFVFEAFDEDWKGNKDPMGAEKHWGLFRIDRRPKLVMKERYPDLGEPKGSVVTIEKRGKGYAMKLNGKPYRIRGVGGTSRLDLAKSLGANAIRTWGSNAWPKAFAQASKLGMTVFAGIWLSHHARDYDDEAYKAKKRKEVEGLAKKWAKHPALLVWCLGNEIQLKANLPKAWKFVEELAQIIRRYDKDHPIATATAHSPPKVLDLIVEHAPSVKLLAVNSYAGLPAVTRDIGRSRYRGPFVITEWGPNGHWETGKTAWGRPIEQTSAEKVAMYRKRARYIDSLPACLGSYVFLWGQKQERTATWYSMFVEKRPKLGLGGEATGAVDVMEEAWSKRKPRNRAPLVSELRVNGKLPGDNLVVKAPAKIEASAKAADADGDALTWVWELLREPAKVGEAGASEARPPRAKDAVATNGAKAKATVTKPGEYRLFVYALDGKGKVGTANFPFKVK